MSIEHSGGFKREVHFVAQSFAEAVSEEVEMGSSGEDLDVAVCGALADRLGFARPTGSCF